MTTTISTATEQVTTVERSYSIERQTPVGGPYKILIHREIVRTLADGTVLSRQAIPDAVYEDVKVTFGRVCARDYLAACQRAKGLSDLMAAESAFYEALVAEVRDEAAKAAAARAAQGNG